ncbi:hypothetical protein OsJ_19148 [Oryza sativa Japonica Group]|uniref:Uncharacterized protein n=1 Tax=Oryza sativa subsp. japonica TaxID=39947 RepID=B9FL22_ORYSJ|nr:hypothetical protein OsJ_19148 [Oryza sativa Japonica Group]
MAEESKRFLYTGADLDHSEDEQDFIVERSPRLQSPISKESSFQQTPPHIRATNRDTHMFPQAISQWQPRSWHCSKRQSNDRVIDDSGEYKNSNHDWQLAKPEDSYSISRCVQILNGMAELSQDGTGCSLFCRCEDCRNPFGKNEGIMAEESKRFLYTGADLDHSEDEQDFIVERSPRLQSPISKESSFQQTPPHIRATNRDTHMFPQAISQWQPRSWHCSKRQSNDRVIDDSGEYKNSNHDWQLAKPEDSYSISRCVQILNGMAELSQVEKSVAPDVFSRRGTGKYSSRLTGKSGPCG